MSRKGDLSVLAVSPVGEAGGAEVLLVDILAGLVAAGAQARLIALGRGPLADLARSRGLSVKAGPDFSFRRPRSVLRCVRIVRRETLEVGPDVVHASHPKGQLVAWLAVRRRDCVLTTQLYDPPVRPGLSTRVAARLPGLRFAITEETASAYRSYRSTLAPVVIPPGRDLAPFVSQATSGDGDAAWLRNGLEGDGPRIVTVARLQRFKGPLDFVAMAEMVHDEVDEARFLIAGPDSPREPQLRGQVHAEIRRRGLDGVVALAGRLTSPDLAATVAGATLLVHPAANEPFGLVLVEALALGTPVIAYASAGPSTILADGGGRLTPTGDVQALARAVVDALLDAELRTGWERHAPSIAARFDLDAIVGTYLENFLDAAGHGR